MTTFIITESMRIKVAGKQDECVCARCGDRLTSGRQTVHERTTWRCVDCAFDDVPRRDRAGSHDAAADA